MAESKSPEGNSLAIRTSTNRIAGIFITCKSWQNFHCRSKLKKLTFEINRLHVGAIFMYGCSRYICISLTQIDLHVKRTCNPLYLISSFNLPTINMNPSSSTLAMSPVTIGGVDLVILQTRMRSQPVELDLQIFEAFSSSPRILFTRVAHLSHLMTVLRKSILQTRMRSHPVGLDV